MPTIDIRSFYNFGGVDLSKPRPKLPLGMAKQFFDYVPPSNLHAGTVTIGTAKIFKMDYYQKCYTLKTALTEYNKLNKNHKYIAFMEDTKTMNPHLHLLIYNGYNSSFIKAFGPLGRRNKHKESFKKVSNLKSYMEYITKEHSPNNDNKYYTNITQEDLDKVINNFNKTFEARSPPVTIQREGGAVPSVGDPKPAVLHGVET